MKNNLLGQLDGSDVSSKGLRNIGREIEREGEAEESSEVSGLNISCHSPRTETGSI